MAIPAFARGLQQFRRASGIFKIYRDIRLAAIASELQMPADALEPELGDAVKRGAQNIDFLSKSRAAGSRGAT